MRMSLALIPLFLFATISSTQEKKLRDKIRESTIKVVSYDHKDNLHCGSGVICHGKDGTTHIITAAHVVDGWPKIEVEFLNVEEGVRLGKTVFFAEILKSSPKWDLAILVLKKKNIGKSAVFDLEKKPRPVDSDIWVCGFFGGEFLTVNKGTVQGHGYKGIFKKSLVDHASIQAARGGSGGGMWTEDGKCCGLLSEISTQHSHVAFYLPMRHILAWAEENNLMYVFNPIEIHKGKVK